MAISEFFFDPCLRPMRIAFIDHRDPTDPHCWSGIPSHMIESLSHYADLQVIGPVNTGIRRLYLGHKCFFRLRRRRFDEERTDLALRIYDRRINGALRNGSAQAVISSSSIPIAHLRCRMPIVFWTDACFAAMRRYYDDFAALSSRSIRDGERQEREALRRCRIAIYSSQWAADGARAYYPESSDKVRVVPFGANLDPAYDAVTVARLIAGKPRDRCNLLFVGVDWSRKGGPIVLEATRLMNAAGLPTMLTIVGCAPFASAPTPYAQVAGFLDPDQAHDRMRLAKLFAESHFLVLPSRAEAYGIVLCEAAAFGLPAIASHTGGIPSIVRHSLTGVLLAKDSSAADYATAMTRLFEDEALYRRMAMAAYEEYKGRLNWPIACQSVMQLLLEDPIGPGALTHAATGASSTGE
jgi:glycosyltransferase involved in cell wall biosynthesis